uniref:Polysaccharide biosynthesis domain-containing protein n=1 Tax=Trepomonas sp. PC1 TaxID=1076344 RepID=A0A146K598_9EUKA|eukprot:JAP92090.1 hypothetical protein TPC1_16078 [Trepomonas sp. PC1]
MKQVNKKPEPKVVNDANLERQWAESAFKYAEQYEQLIFKTKDEAINKFRFTKDDDKIYERFQLAFKGLEVNILDVNDIKSQKNKLLWYNFLESNKHLCKDYNLGTLIRVDSQKQFGETNSVVVPRLQFYCIELQRFRTGLNLSFKQKFVAQATDAPVESLDEIDKAIRNDGMKNLFGNIDEMIKK